MRPSFSNDEANSTVKIMQTTAAKSQTICLTAASGAKRKTKVIPTPASTNAIGKMAGSAFGVNFLSAKCAAKKATIKAIGTENDETLSCAPSLMSNIAKNTNKIGVAAMSSQSSVVRLLVIYFFLKPFVFWAGLDAPAAKF